MKAGRKITNGPRVYMAGDTVNEAFRHPVIIEVVVEGVGAIDVDALRQAVAAASRANPGTRLIARGNLHATRLVDTGITPPIRQIDGSRWSGKSAEGLSFYRFPLPIRSGPTCDVILMTGPVTRIMFRGHHTVIDGQGLMMWIEDVFRVLRGETPAGSTWTESIDQFRRVTPVNEPKWTGGQCVAPTGMPRGETNRAAFSRLELPGPVSNLMPRLMMLTAQAARQHHPDGRVVFGIPISLRHRQAAVRSSSNLSRAIYVDVAPDTTVADIDQSIHHHRQTDGRLSFSETLIPFLPLWVIRKFLETDCRKGIHTGRYWVSGFISNLGRFETKQFSTREFAARSVFLLPPCSCSIPVFFILLGVDRTISINVSMPENLADGNRLDDFMAYLRRGLSPCPVQPDASHLKYAVENHLTPHLSPEGKSLPSAGPEIDCNLR
ncbi:MAG: hypothetical protein AB1724_17215 [Thermodesulfobacteriota bacterium]